MKKIKMSLFDHDHAVQAKTNMNFDDNQKEMLATFIKQIHEELVTGATAFLEIEGLQHDQVTFEITQAP
jgi:hypothetical protein